MQNKLESKIQNFALRWIYRLPRTLHSLGYHRELAPQPFLHHLQKERVVLLMHTIIQQTSPTYLRHLVSLRSQHCQGKNTRGSDHKLFVIRPNTKYMRNSLSYLGTDLWNKLGKEVKGLSTNQLKTVLKSNRDRNCYYS